MQVEKARQHKASRRVDFLLSFGREPWADSGNLLALDRDIERLFQVPYASIANNDAHNLSYSIIALHSFGAIRDVRHEGCDFLRRVRICNVDDAQSVREPRNRNFSTADLIAELVQAGVILLRRSIFLGHLEAGEGDWPRLIGNI